LRQKRAQAVLGWRLAAGLDAAGQVRVDASDRAGAPLDGLKVDVHLERPATEAGQRDVALHRAAPGVYMAPMAPAQGAWDLSVTASDAAGHVAKVERRVSLP
jgi:nitrogen fixation protein FixH